MSEELKPCPFCGHAAKLNSIGKKSHSISCDNYEDACLVIPVAHDITIDRAERVWNTRPIEDRLTAANKRLSERVEALEAVLRRAADVMNCARKALNGGRDE